MKEMTCTIITPAGTVVDHKHILSATIPTMAGGIMVFPEHQPVISTLALGVITLALEHGAKETFVTSDGIIRILPHEIVILSEFADPQTDEIKKKIAQAYEKAKEKEASSLSAPELVQLEKQLRYQRFVLDMAD
jgi:ATP synthase F1 epsilon subunit